MVQIFSGKMPRSVQTFIAELIYGNNNVLSTAAAPFVQEKLQEKRVMPSFITEMSTTNDVVRQAIIPLSRRGAAGKDQGVARAGRGRGAWRS